MVAGKYLILLVYPNGFPTETHLYYADLEKHGEINGKIPLNPVYTTDLNTDFNVSWKTKLHWRFTKMNFRMNESFSVYVNRGLKSTLPNI